MPKLAKIFTIIFFFGYFNFGSFAHYSVDDLGLNKDSFQLIRSIEDPVPEDGYAIGDQVHFIRILSKSLCESKSFDLLMCCSCSRAVYNLER